MATVLVLVGVLAGVWAWRTARFGAVWAAMTGAKSVANVQIASTQNAA